MQHISAGQLRKLFNDHGAALALYARQWCLSPEDALQEAFIELAKAEPVPDSPLAWLFKAVRCRAMNQARAEQRRTRHHLSAAQQRDTWFVPDAPASLDLEQLQASLTTLPPLEREIVVARIWGDLTFEQIAELVERSVSAVHRQYQQALAHLACTMSTNEERETQS